MMRRLLIIEALQRLYMQRTDVINTINEDKVELTIENWALGKAKICEILRSFGASTSLT